MKFFRTAAIAIAACCLAFAASAQQVARQDRPLLEVAEQLRNGQYVWAPELSPSGAMLLVVNLATQRAILFRNGVPIAASTISTGRPGYETPLGVFTILQKSRTHFSSTYDNAPMPNMQRLTWKGIALHAGYLPGYPASHGCIRLPPGFASLLFGTTELGMTVVITSVPAAPAGSDVSPLATSPTPSDVPLDRASFEWHPERSPAKSDSIVSVVVSAADSKAVVLRNGIQIGSAPVRVRGETRPMAYVLRAWNSTGQHWLRLQFGGNGEGMDIVLGEGRRFEAPALFRHHVLSVLKPGSVVIITPASLQSGSTGREQTVIEEEQPKPPR